MTSRCFTLMTGLEPATGTKVAGRMVPRRRARAELVSANQAETVPATARRIAANFARSWRNVVKHASQQK